MVLDSPQNALRVFALDAPSIRRGEVDIRTQLGSTAQLFFFYLLTTETAQQREILAEIFWPERSAKQAASNLRTVLSQLRSSGVEQLTVTREAVAIHRRGLHYDVVAFRAHLAQADLAFYTNATASAVSHWEAAVQLYQRPFLAGLRETKGPDLQLWLSLERELLHNQFLGALRQLADCYTQQNNYAALLPLAQRWFALEPLELPAVQAVMQALTHTGQPESALSHYRAYLRLYQQEYGNVPVPTELAALADRIIKEGHSRSALPAVRTTVAALPAVTTLATESERAVAVRRAPQTMFSLGSTPLIGRASEVAAVRTLLVEKKERLVTIVGLGGLGKTRLALAVAEASQADFADGVWFVALDVLKGTLGPGEPTSHYAQLCEQIATAIGNALGLTFAGGYTLAEQLTNQLRKRQICLVLDNFEPLLAAAAFLLQLLDRVPGLSLLATSRVRLNLSTEALYNLSGLALPQAATIDAVKKSAAGQLFVASAQRQLAHFALDAPTAAAVAQLCQLTAGLPLALILASTWVEHLSPAEIVNELQTSLALLAADTRNLPLRQQSMQQIIEVSWQALSPAEQLVLAQLSLFVEPFQRHAAQAVANATLAQLRTLTDKALLTIDSPGIYCFHPLIHHVAQQKLRDLQIQRVADTMGVHERYAAYIRQCTGALVATLGSTAPQAGDRRRWQGYGDVQAVLEWQLAEQPTAVVAFLIELYPLWDYYGYIGEARQWLQRGLAQAAPATIARAELARRAGACAEKQHDLTVARDLLLEALQIYQAHGDIGGEAATLAVLGWVTFHERSHYTDVQPALRYIERSLQLYRTIANQRQMAHQLRDIGQLLIMENQCSPTVIQPYLHEALALYQRLSDQTGEALVWKLLGHLALAQDQYATAATYVDQAILCAGRTAMVHDLAWIYHMRCSIAYAQQDWTGLQEYSSQAHDLFAAVQDPHGMMLILFYRGWAEQHLGNSAAALAALRTSLQLAQRQELLYWTVRNLVATASVVAARQWPAAATLGGVVETIFTEQEERFTLWERKDLCDLLATVRAYSPSPIPDAAWAAGRHTSLATAIEIALQLGQDASGQG